MEDGTIVNDGFILSDKKRKKPVSKDPNPELFWNDFPRIKDITRLKTMNPKWGSVKILKVLSYQANERMMRKVLENYFFDERSGYVFKKSVDMETSHRRCISREEMISLIRKNHETDHRKSTAIYESIRRAVFPVVRENVKVLFDMFVKCDKCNAAANLPRTKATRKPIPATYPNSRWQIDLKKMPSHKGFNYVCNIVDCYSRFAFAKATKGKTAREIASIVLHFIYIFGSPRILQSDNGKEFRNADLEEVVKEFESIQMHGRPYHPQSQGRVERFNRTMTDYFRVKMSTCSDWPEHLEEFYYSYNNRLNKATRSSTPYQLFYRRPNFAAPVDEQVPYATLTKEEREFLAQAHVDVEAEDSFELNDNDDMDKDHMDNDWEDDENNEENAQAITDNDEVILNPPTEMIEVAEAEVSRLPSVSIKSAQENQSPPKKWCNVTALYRERQRQVLRDFPLEQFSATEYYPQEGHQVYFRPNAAMNKGIAVFTTGFWRKGVILSVKKTNGGSVYKVKA